MQKIQIWNGETPINGVPAEEVLKNREDLARALGDIFLVMNGDMVSEIQIGKVIAANYKMEEGLSLEEIADAYMTIKQEEAERMERDFISIEELQKEIAAISYEVMMLQEPIAMYKVSNGISSKYEQIRKWYKNKLWSTKMVKDATNKGRITQEECDKILNNK